ncbi:MAG: Autophagy protein 7 [Trizodia sp. TS-e1964]|nr:MAG: Autophagy protein 7 [Trizodia sp. TS-e1964]
MPFMMLDILASLVRMLTQIRVPSGFYRAEGIIRNLNTIEDYKNLDKAALLQRAGQMIWDAINDDTIYSCPSLLSSFTVVSFANLKKYHFTYWFGFPALHSNVTWKPVNAINKTFDHLETTALVDCVQSWRYRVDTRQYGFFLAKKVRGTQEKYNETPKARITSGRHRSKIPLPPSPPVEGHDYIWQVESISSFGDGFFNDVPLEDQYVAFVDPSTYPENPGWMLRNLLVLIRERWKLDTVQILCYRDIQDQRDNPKSFVLHLVADPGMETRTESPNMPKVTGWERNKSGKLASKTANLAEYMDPRRLADQSVDLNLKLMKWRIAPDLNLDVIKNSRCLLLGAGTLGSYVARNLLGWGVRTITFVDNATVSFSNPVRQPLFTFNDCLNGGAKKAIRAAKALQEIYPGVESYGHTMSVPMAGHPVMDEKKENSDFLLLKKLIDEHDVIFLLMDTRESRWLPSVIGKATGKIVMNAALGFDTYVVMRHGVKVEEHPENELGCYFCNDVVAPADSIKDQTLDQQCTVTRPGIAAMASALLVELLVSILQHPSGAAAPAPTSPSQDRGAHPLGQVPHQIRGFLSNFQNMNISGRSYDCCSACSTRVVDEYKAHGWEFVKKALNEKGYVEELSGLAEVQRSAEKAAADIEWDDEGGALSDDGEGELI